MKVEKTTFEVEGVQEPCIIVSDDDESVKVRISTCYHYLGSNTLLLTEFIDGDYNSSDEWVGDFSSLTLSEATRLAKKFSAYLN